jgi:chromosome segregation ATPase
VDLNDSLQKCKQEMIGLRAQQEQQLLAAGEEHAAEVEKLREVGGERERRLLQVERELAEVGEKVRRIDSEKKKLEEERERNS